MSEKFISNNWDENWHRLEKMRREQSVRHNQEMRELYTRFIATDQDLNAKFDARDMTAEKFKAWLMFSAELNVQHQTDRMSLRAEIADDIETEL